MSDSDFQEPVSIIEYPDIPEPEIINSENPQLLDQELVINFENETVMDLDWISEPPPPPPVEEEEIYRRVSSNLSAAEENKFISDITSALVEEALIATSNNHINLSEAEVQDHFDYSETETVSSDFSENYQDVFSTSALAGVIDSNPEGEDNSKGIPLEDVSQKKSKDLETNVSEENVFEDDSALFSGSTDLEDLTEENVIHDIMKGLTGDDPVGQLEALMKIHNPPILIPVGKLMDKLVEVDIVHRLIEFIRSKEISATDLKYYAAWTISAIASGSDKRTGELVRAGAIRPLIKLLESPCPNTAYQAAHGLGDIASKGQAYIPMLVSGGVIPRIIHLAEVQTDVSHLKTTAWVMMNLCKVPVNVPVLPRMIQLIPAFTNIILHHDDLDLLYEACRGLYFLSKSGNEDVIDDIIESGIVTKLVQTLDNITHKVMKPCVEIIGNIVSGFYDSQTDVVLRAGVLPHLLTLILNPKFMKEITWIVSNIAAGTAMQRHELFEAGFLPLIIEVLRTGNLASRKEATFTVFNIIDGGSFEQIRFLRDNGTIPLLINLLSAEYWELNTLALDSLVLMLRTFREMDERDIVIGFMEESGGLIQISKLQFDDRPEVPRKVAYILDLALKNMR